MLQGRRRAASAVIRAVLSSVVWWPGRSGPCQRFPSLSARFHPEDAEGRRSRRAARGIPFRHAALVYLTTRNELSTGVPPRFLMLSLIPFIIAVQPNACGAAPTNRTSALPGREMPLV